MFSWVCLHGPFPDRRFRASNGAAAVARELQLARYDLEMRRPAAMKLRLRFGGYSPFTDWKIAGKKR